MEEYNLYFIISNVPEFLQFIPIVSKAIQLGLDGTESACSALKVFQDLHEFFLAEIGP